MAEWTIDSIAHALPHPDARQNFLREVNLTPLPELPSVLAKWEWVAQEWTDATPRLEALRAYAIEHGTMPPEYETPEAIALSAMFLEQLSADAAMRRTEVNAA